MKRVTAIVLAAFMIAQGAYAAEITSDGYDISDGHYRVSGKANTGGEPVKIEVFNNGYDEESAKNVTPENISEIYLYADQIYAGEDKNFSFDIPVGDGKGNYKVKVGFFDGTLLWRSFCTYSDEEVEEKVRAFVSDSDKTAEKLAALIEDYYPALNVDLGDVKTLSESDSKRFYETALSGISADTTKDELSRKINGALAFTLVSSSGDAAVLLKYENYTTLRTANYYTDWKDLLTETKQQICLSAKGAATVAEMDSRIENAVILNALKNTIWSGQKNKLEYYKENLLLDLSDINKLGEEAQKNVYVDFKAALTANEITDISKIEGYLDVLYTKYKSYESTEVKNNPYGGGGGGGSSSGGGSFTAPVNEEVRPSEAALPFGDIAQIDWASVPVVKLYQMGIVNGKEDGIFDPFGNVTREEFAAMIVRALGLSGGSDGGFADVAASRWSSAAISAAKESGIVDGIGENMFAPEDNILRQDMAVIACRAAKLSGVELDETATLSFDDKENIAEYARTSVAALNGAGIITGSDNMFYPNDCTTRAEAAVVIYRLLEQCKLVD